MASCAHDLKQDGWSDAPIITTRNSLANAVNTLRHQGHCYTENVENIHIAASDFIGNYFVSSRYIKGEIMRQEDSWSAKLKPDLPRNLTLAKGTKIRLTENIKTELGLVNGGPGIRFYLIIYRARVLHYNRSQHNCS